MSTVKGTLPYMAPEILNLEPGSGIQFDNRAADMWSLGEMAHRMLTATPTFSSPAALNNYMIWPDTLPFQKLAEHGASGDVLSFIRAVMKPRPDLRLTSDKALEHTWIQPCKPSNVNLAPSRTSTPAYAIFLFPFVSTPFPPGLACRQANFSRVK
jgi:serine/threonine protein kinase